MITKNYIDAVIENAKAELIENHDATREELEVNEDIFENVGDECKFTGNFEEDTDMVYDMYLECTEPEDLPEDEPEVISPEKRIEDVVNGLHVGYNYVPGIGFGYCADEEDLQRMKDFVRGGMVAKEMMNMMMGGLM